MEAIRTLIATLKEIAAKGARFTTRTVLRTDGGRRLAFFQLQRAGRQLEHRATERDCA